MFNTDFIGGKHSLALSTNSVNGLSFDVLHYIQLDINGACWNVSLSRCKTPMKYILPLDR